MIRNRQDLQHYLEADRLGLRRGTTSPTRYDEVWIYQRLLRRVEYLTNTSGGMFHDLVRKYWSWRLHEQSVRCGFEIPLNTFGPGLSIAHRGTIIVHPDARIGINCRIHIDVVIGTRPGPPPEPVPRIGNNCYIGPGAKIFGDVVLGDNLVVGANAVVDRSFPEGHMTIAGVPARKISDTPSDEYIIATRTRSNA
ncbi:MAG: serine acetyltransferase [Flavobacteriales bacterium]|nr:serine acetyltransferase [Flavobacteriales bacterium]